MGGTTYTRRIGAGTSMQGQEPAEAVFGLGVAALVDTVEVEWPDGSVTTESNIAANQMIDVLPEVEIAIGPPNTASTQNGPIEWVVSYAGVDSVTLGPSDVTLVATGSAIGTLSVLGSGTSQRTVSVTGLSGVGSLTRSRRSAMLASSEHDPGWPSRRLSRWATRL